MPSIQFHDLAHAFLDGRASEADAARLSQILRTDASARDAYLRLADVHACLAVDERMWCPSMNAPLGSATTVAVPRRDWLRPVLAAIVGLVLGLGSAGLVFAYVVPAAVKTIILLRESFEAGPAPVAAGLPVECDTWGGDRTAIVAAEQGIAPREGQRMLRMLTANYEGKALADGYVADLHRFIDVRRYRDAIATGNAILHLSAGMNAIQFPDHERYEASVDLYAIDSQCLSDQLPTDLSVLGEVALASARRLSSNLDRDVTTWQVMGGELRLPPATEFVLIHLSIRHATPEQVASRSTFAGHYMDDVRAWIDVEASRPRAKAP